LSGIFIAILQLITYQLGSTIVVKKSVGKLM